MKLKSSLSIKVHQLPFYLSRNSSNLFPWTGRKFNTWYHTVVFLTNIFVQLPSKPWLNSPPSSFLLFFLPIFHFFPQYTFFNCFLHLLALHLTWQLLQCFFLHLKTAFHFSPAKLPDSPPGSYLNTQHQLL